MGGEQAAGVLSTVRKFNSPEEEQEFKKQTISQYEKEGHPYFSSARFQFDFTLISLFFYFFLILFFSSNSGCGMTV